MLRIIIVYDNKNFIPKELCVNQLIKHLESINAEINYNGEELSEEQLNSIPAPLQELYKKIDSIEIDYAPFYQLEIYDLETSIDKTTSWFKLAKKNQDLTTNWFIFGEGMSSLVLLCAYKEDEEGLSFAYWDYESDVDIDGAICSSLYELLLEIEEEYEDLINEELEQDKEEDGDDDY